MNSDDIELLAERVPRPAEPSPSSSSSSTDKKTRVMFFGMTLVLLVNCILIGTLVVELRQAKQQVNHIQTQMAPVIQAASSLASLGRMIHGNVPDMINSLLQSNFQRLGSDVYQQAEKVEAAFDQPTDMNMLNVAKYSSLVKSISARLTTFNPPFPETPSSDPDGDTGVLNVLSYITAWIDLQTNVTSISNLGKSCDIFSQAMINTDWSGYYSWFGDRFFPAVGMRIV